MSPLHVEQSSLLVPVAASLERCDTLTVGQVVTADAVIEWKGEAAYLGAALRIYDPSGRCVLRSAVKDLGEIAGGTTRLHFYFLADMPLGAYALSFEYWKVGKNSAEVVDVDVAAGNGILPELLSLNNLFLEMTLRGGAEQSGLQEEFAGFRKFPVEVAASIWNQSSPNRGPDNNSTKHFPWPLVTEKYTRNEIEEAIRWSLDPDIPLPDSTALMSQNSGPRQFLGSSERIGTQVGERVDDKIRTTGRAGLLVYGPYLPIFPGVYCVTIRGSVGRGGASGFTLDVVAKRGGKIFGRQQFGEMTEGPCTEFELKFTVDEPGCLDLETRLHVKAGDEFIFESLTICCAGVEREAKHFNQSISELLTYGSIAGAIREKKYPDVNFVRLTHPALYKKGSVALIYVLDDIFLPFCLAIADYIKKTYGLQSVLIYSVWSPFYRCAVGGEGAVCEIISVAKYQRSLFKNIDVDIFVSHSWGEEDTVANLINISNPKRFIVYGDGFKQWVTNACEKYKKIDGAIYFGSVPVEIDVPLEVNIAPRNVLLWYDFLSDFVRFDAARMQVTGEKYGMVYLRYYGAGVYKFSPEIVLEIMVRTIKIGCAGLDKLVIKNDRRVPAWLSGELMERLAKEGFDATSLEEVLIANGENPANANLSAEFLFGRGYCCDAAVHICFDSAVAYSIVAAREIFSETRVIIGADLDFIIAGEITESGYIVESFAGAGSVVNVDKVGLSTIQVWSRKYFEFIRDCQYFLPARLSKLDPLDMYCVEFPN